MDFSMVVNASVERLQGKFASRDELEEEILGWLEAANEQTLEGADGGEYEVTEWNVEANAAPNKSKAKKEPTADIKTAALTAIRNMSKARELIDVNAERVNVLLAVKAAQNAVDGILVAIERKK